MTIDDHTGGIEESISIDAPRADIFAVLTAGEPVFEACTGLTVSTDEEGVTVTDAGPEGASPSVFSGQVHVTEREEPTNLTMVFDGATESTVEWTLQPEETNTLVTATATNGLPDPNREGITGGGKDEATGSDSSASESSHTAPLTDVLGTLQTLCEQPPPLASMAARVEIPEIYCPFPAEISPHLEEVTAHVQEWAQEMGLIDEPSSEIAIVSGFPCRMYAQSPFEALCLNNYCSLWGFFHDDTSDPMNPVEMQRLHQPLSAVLDGESPDPHQRSLVRALADICQRLSARMPQDWYDRFAAHHREYFTGTEWEAHNRASNTIPDRHTFIPNRQMSSRIKVYLDLVEVAIDTPLPSDVYQRETVRALREAAVNAVAWTNDVYSLHKELASGETLNLVVVIWQGQGCSMQEAINETCELIDAEIRRFEALSHRLTVGSDTDDTLQAYITGIERIIGGNLAWSKETMRYEVPD